MQSHQFDYCNVQQRLWLVWRMVWELEGKDTVTAFGGCLMIDSNLGRDRLVTITKQGVMIRAFLLCYSSQFGLVPRTSPIPEPGSDVPFLSSYPGVVQNLDPQFWYCCIV